MAEKELLKVQHMPFPCYIGAMRYRRLSEVSEVTTRLLDVDCFCTPHFGRQSVASAHEKGYIVSPDGKRWWTFDNQPVIFADPNQELHARDVAPRWQAFFTKFRWINAPDDKVTACCWLGFNKSMILQAAQEAFQVHNGDPAQIFLASDKNKAGGYGSWLVRLSTGYWELYTAKEFWENFELEQSAQIPKRLKQGDLGVQLVRELTKLKPEQYMEFGQHIYGGVWLYDDVQQEYIVSGKSALYGTELEGRREA